MQLQHGGRGPQVLLGRSREDLGFTPLGVELPSEEGEQSYFLLMGMMGRNLHVTCSIAGFFCMILPVPGWKGWQGWLQAPSLGFAVSIRTQDEYNT